MTAELGRALQAPANRIKEAATHWLTAVNAYHDPEGFRVALNACIQATRNVTFALQGSKAVIPNFQQWYAGWQAAMRDDFLMKWCVEARNRIVKQSDLETHSIAMASLVVGYHEPPVAVFAVSPFSSSRDIALQLQQDLAKTQRDHGYLYVERRWTAEDLPDFEILETLAYALFVLKGLLMDVVDQRGPRSVYGPGGPPAASAFENGVIDDKYLPGFAATFRKHRSTWLDLRASEFVHIGMEEFQVGPNDGEKAAKRYQFSNLQLEKEVKKRDLKGRVHFFLTIGKRILEVDGFHVHRVFLIDRKDRMSTITPRFTHFAEKPLIWTEIARQAKKERATAIFAVLETWTAPLDPEFPARRAEESPQRGEMLQAIGFSHRGTGYAVGVPFNRQDKHIIFGPEIPLDLASMRFLQPFRHVWRKTIRAKGG